MAKAVREIGRGQVKDWFAGLTFEVQQSVLDDLAKTFDVSKAERISALENELAALRVGRVTAVKRGRQPGQQPQPVTGDKRKGPSPKKGLKVEPKYRHPSSGQTWAGRGVYPTWINEYLKKRGNKLDDLLIKK